MQNSLKHYGVLGMRWGVRRATVPSSSDHKLSRDIKRKKLHQMSNDEIKILSTRLQLEAQYKSLNPGKIAKGKRAVDEVFSIISKISLAATTIGGLIAGGKKVYEAAKKVHNK